MDAFVVRGGGDAAAEAAHEPGPKKQRTSAPATEAPRLPRVVSFNCDGLANLLVEAGGTKPLPDYSVLLASLHSHECSAGAPPDVLMLQELHVKASPTNQGAAAPGGPGTGTAAQRRSAERDEAALRLLTSPPSPFSGYRPHLSLNPDKRSSGVAAYVAPWVAPPTRVRRSLDDSAPDSAHHPDGRVLWLEWPHLTLLAL